MHISGPELTERMEGGIIAEGIVLGEDDSRARTQLWSYIDPSRGLRTKCVYHGIFMMDALGAESQKAIPRNRVPARATTSLYGTLRSEQIARVVIV